MTKISAVSAYGPGGASTRVRLYDWFKHLHLDVELHEYMSASANQPGTLLKSPGKLVRAEFNLRRISATSRDVLLLSREASPLSRGHLECRLLESAKRSILDFDDAIYLRTGGFRDLVANQAAKTRRMTECADQCIVGNPVLAEWASRHSSNVTVIPSCIEPSDYAMKSSWDLADPPKFIWLGSPSTERYLSAYAPALESLWRRTGAITVVISGAGGPHPGLEPFSHIIERVRWEPGLAERRLKTGDIGLAPLLDEPFARGKCAYKLLQYAASGLPMVGSPVGANAEALSRFHGLTAQTMQDWEDALLALIQEGSAQREARGRAARQSVEMHYSFGAWRERWTRVVLG